MLTVVSAALHGFGEGGEGTQQKSEQKDRRHEHHSEETGRKHQFIGDLPLLAAGKFANGAFCHGP